MKTPKYVQAFYLLLGEAKRARNQELPPFSPYLTVQNPTQLLERMMKISHPAALQYLKQLKNINAISTEQVGVGQYYQSASMLKESLEPTRHELDEDTRLTQALWQHKRKSTSGPWIVHAFDFDLAQKAADIHGEAFYFRLHILEADGFLQCVRKGRNNRILYVKLSEQFPKPSKNTA